MNPRRFASDTIFSIVTSVMLVFCIMYPLEARSYLTYHGGGRPRKARVPHDVRGHVGKRAGNSGARGGVYAGKTYPLQKRRLLTDLRGRGRKTDGNSGLPRRRAVHTDPRLDPADVPRYGAVVLVEGEVLRGGTIDPHPPHIRGKCRFELRAPYLVRSVGERENDRIGGLASGLGRQRADAPERIRLVQTLRGHPEVARHEDALRYGRLQILRYARFGDALSRCVDGNCQ